MRRVPNLDIFTIVMSAELGHNMLVPLLAFIFFSADSPLFSISTVSITERSLLFGLCLSLYKFSSAFAHTVITALSDHIGRKIALYCNHTGLLMVSIFGMLALVIHSPFLLIGGFFLTGLLDTTKATGPAMIGDISNSQNRIHNMATMQCIISLGACIGPIIGGQLGYTSSFIMAALIAVFSLWLVRRCPETLPMKNPLEISFLHTIKEYKALFKSSSIRHLFFLLILCQLSWSCYYEFITPTLKNVFNFSAPQVGIFIGLIAFWLFIATAIIIRWLLYYFNPKQLIWLSAAAVALGTLLSSWAGANPDSMLGRPILWLGAIPTAVGDVIFFSLFISSLSRATGEHQQGKAMGLTIMIAMLVWSVTALIGGYLLTIHPNGALLFAPLGSLGLLLTLSCGKELVL